MKHKKGLIILIILTIISLIGGIQGIISTLADTDSFSFHFSTSQITFSFFTSNTAFIWTSILEFAFNCYIELMILK